MIKTHEITMDNVDPHDLVSIIRVTVDALQREDAIAYAINRFPGFKMRYVIAGSKVEQDQL